jgi:hypothetical protein
MQTEIPIADTQVILYPELVAASLKQKEGELYALWSILKGMDKSAKGSGKIAVSDLIDFVRTVFGVEQSRAYDKFRQGIGKYWNKPGRDARGIKVTCLIGRAAVIERLNPTSTRSEPFTFTVKNLESEDIHELKNLLISVVAARYIDERPISVQSIALMTGQSESTVKRAVKECVDVNSIGGFQTISEHSSEHEARMACAKLSKDIPAAYKVQQHLNKYVVCRQLPNTYTLCSPGRLPLRKRPKELKAKDAENMAGLVKKRYYKKMSKKPVTHEHAQYSGVVMLPGGLATMWDSKNKKTTKKPKENRSIAGKWNQARKGVSKNRKMDDNRNINNVSI